MNQVEKASIDHLIAKGIQTNVAMGIVAVLYRESRLNPGSQGNQASERGGVLNPNGAYGIASWNGPRQGDLQAFAAKKGLPVDDVNTQLDFVLTESANSYPDVWAAIQKQGISISDFITVFVDKYEIPKDTGTEIADSLAIANGYVANYVVNPPVTPPNPPIVDNELMVLSQVLALLGTVVSKNAAMRIIDYVKGRIETP